MTDELDRNAPLDPDSGPRRLLLRPLVLVALGGAAGTTARYLLGETISDVAGMPFGIFAINLTGAFLLGWLIEALARYGPDTGRRRDLRLLLGTGVIGGFTTYSALAADTAVLLRDGTPGSRPLTASASSCSAPWPPLSGSPWDDTFPTSAEPTRDPAARAGRRCCGRDRLGPALPHR